MAQSSRYFRIDEDVLLEFIYHDQGDVEKYRIEVDDNGSRGYVSRYGRSKSVSSKALN